MTAFFLLCLSVEELRDGGDATTALWQARVVFPRRRSGGVKTYRLRKMCYHRCSINTAACTDASSTVCLSSAMASSRLQRGFQAQFRRDGS